MPVEPGPKPGKTKGRNPAEERALFSCKGSGDKILSFHVPIKCGIPVSYTHLGYDFTLYLNGSPAGSGQAARALTAESNDISIGVNNWDDLYKGLIDEVQVYDQALTPSQVYQLYDSRSEEEIFEEEGFTADERITMYEGSSQQIQVNLPGGVTEENAEISFEVWDGTIASVSEDGTVQMCIRDRGSGHVSWKNCRDCPIRCFV